MTGDIFGRPVTPRKALGDIPLVDLSHIRKLRVDNLRTSRFGNQAQEHERLIVSEPVLVDHPVDQFLDR